MLVPLPSTLPLLANQLPNIALTLATCKTYLAVSPSALAPFRKADPILLAQTLTIDITLCGDFAGNADLLAETCGALVGDNTW